MFKKLAQKVITRVSGIIDDRLNIKIYRIQIKSNHNCTSEIALSDELHLKYIDNSDIELQKDLPALDISERFLTDEETKNSQCIAAMKDTQIVGYIWRTSSQTKINSNIRISFPREYFYYYKSFVLPQYRGIGMAPAIKEFDFKNIDFENAKIFSYISLSNPSSFRTSTKSGFITKGWVLIFFDRFIFHTKGTKKAGISFYRFG